MKNIASLYPTIKYTFKINKSHLPWKFLVHAFIAFLIDDFEQMLVVKTKTVV